MAGLSGPARLAPAVDSCLHGEESVSALLRLSRLIDALNTRLGHLVYWAVLVAVLVSAGNAVIRKALNISSNAWLEAQWYLFSLVFLFGAGYTLLRGEHIKIDIVYGHLSRRTQLWIEILGTVFFLLPASIIIMGLSWPVFVESYRINEQSMNAGGLPIWPARLLVPIGFLLLVLQGLSELVKRIAVLTGHVREEEVIVQAEPEIDTSIVQVKE
jgi:TRAP-type mannitol/chloroaromatic compound transport system permease small subunit